MIGERTRAALSARKAQGARLGNRRNPSEAAALGRQMQVEKADGFAANIVPVIDAIRASGIESLAGIADALNARGIRSARGSRWHVSTVRNIVLRRDRLL